MIKVIVTKNREGYQRIVSKGHAGYAEEGSDIICAAVSALLITTVNGLEAYTEDVFSAEQRDGYLSIAFEKAVSERGTLLLDTLILGLTQIQESYGKQYLRLETREVYRT